VGIAIPYLLFVFWSIYLLTVLPDATGKYDPLIPLGALGATIFGVLTLAIAALGFLRIQGAPESVPLFRKRMAMLRLGIATIPILLLCAVVPFAISREPPLTLAITSPTRLQDFVAPLSVTFDLEETIEILARRNLHPDRYAWDFNGDGKTDQETIEPQATAQYDQSGLFTVVATITLKEGDIRRVVRRLEIPKAVFTVEPSSPVVDEITRFSIASLVKREDVESVKWDFGDGGDPVVTKELEVVRTFFIEGPVDVKAKVTLKNKAQTTYERTVEVIKEVPLPFPVAFASEPEHLIGPPPFGAMFQVQTDEPVRVVLWNFGDGSDAVRGNRVGHTFTDKGIFAVVAELRAESGKVAKITKIVRVVDELQLSDLKFVGTPEVQNNRIVGEVPITVDLQPRTSMPLVEFIWEAPEATSVGSTKGSIQAVYRRKGIYTLTLLGLDPDGRVLRLPITVEVKSASSSVDIRMEPDGGVAPLTVRLDASETVIPNEEISGFEWIFSDEKNSPHQQGAQVSHVFEKPGTYEVQVKIFTTSGKEFSGGKTVVVRNPVIDACISASRTNGKAPLGIQFSSDCATLGQHTTFSWDFGDGWKSDEANPKHSFQEPGEYQVVLTLKDGDSVSKSDPLTITVSAP
jgi:PKD repeat protein